MVILGNLEAICSIFERMKFSVGLLETECLNRDDLKRRNDVRRK